MPSQLLRYDEAAVAAGHPTLADTVNRAFLIEHNEDGSHPSSIFFPAGTKVFFYQNSAPVGWTTDAAVADALLSVKGGANAYNVNGGNLAGTWTQPNHTHTGPSHTHSTGSFTLTATEIPSHTHSVSQGSGFSGGRGTTGSEDQGSNNIGSAGGGGAHNHGATGAEGTGVTGDGATAITYRPYAAVGIIAAKD